jgi:hypothetical protein
VSLRPAGLPSGVAINDLLPVEWVERIDTHHNCREVRPGGLPGGGAIAIHQ